MKKDNSIQYLKKLAHSTSNVFFGLIELITVLIDITIGGSIPKYLYLWIFIIGLIYSNYKVYQDAALEKEKLINKLLILENKLPKIKIGFLKGTDITQVLAIELKPITTVPDYDQLIKKEHERLLSNLVTHERNSEINDRLNMNWLHLSQINKDYEKDIVNYLPKYRKYLIEQYYYYIHKTHLLPIHPVVQNVGSGSADNLHLEFHIPSIFRIANENEIRWLSSEAEEYYRHIKPKKPILYKNILDIAASSIPAIYSLPSVQHIPQDIEGPSFEKGTNSYNILLYKIKSINPKFIEKNIDPFFLWLDEIKINSTIEIPVIVYASNLLNKVESNLKIKINIIKNN